MSTLPKLVEYLRAEADFNRSWADGRRGADRNFPAAYKARRIELAEERETWARELERLIESVSKKGPGRPPRAGRKAAGDRFEIRLTGSERARWEAAANRERLSLAEWLRAAAELAIARGSTR